MDLRPGELLEMSYYMVLSRTFEERVSTLYKQGRVQAGVFSGIGQEAICVGTCYGLEDEDFVAPAHRDTGVFLVKGVSPRAIMAQLYGRKTGLSGGKDSALHAGEPELNVFGTTSMLGAQICVTTGAGLAFKMRQQPHVAVSYFGEGAAARGDFHEALNFAGVHRLPCIFVCENNHYAYSTPLKLQMACESLADRALGYGFAGKVVDGNDILAVWKTMREALYRARTGAGATLVECMTYRWHGHQVRRDHPARREDGLPGPGSPRRGGVHRVEEPRPDSAVRGLSAREAPVERREPAEGGRAGEGRGRRRGGLRREQPRADRGGGPDQRVRVSAEYGMRSAK